MFSADQAESRARCWRRGTVNREAQPFQLAFSPAERRALEALAELDRKNRRAGADVRFEAYRITEDLPRLRDWLEESDRLVDELPGAKRLRRRRRRGILRHTDGSLRGMPYFEPPMYPTTFAPEPRLGYLRDEMEALVIPGRYENAVWRPAKDEITFDEARAIAMMKAGTLYRLTSKRRAPGLIRRGLGPDSESHTAELRFLSVDYMRWGVVLSALVKSRR
jgi:hypothetical protein